jgi:Uma2 family endonuclease
MALDKLKDAKLIAMEDFLRDFNEAPFEFIYGERIPWMPSVARHTETLRAVVRFLEAFVLKHQLGEVFSEATFDIEHKTDWVEGSLTPDILFYEASRFAKYKQETKDWGDKPYAIVPDIVIEIVSPNDRYTKINRKVMVYLFYGVKYVWVIDPQEENALVHSKNKTIILNKEDSISGEEVLLDFAMPLGEIFPKE